MIKEEAYWIALAHLPRWGFLKINHLIIKFHHEKKISIHDFFDLTQDEWQYQFQLDDKEIADLMQAKSELTANAFLAESLLSQGFELIPITSPEYSTVLKTNLKTSHCPPVLYVKGNKQIFKEKSVAIVGSRDASANSLNFTDNIAGAASKDFKVIVSGFAKGVDKQALDSAIRYKGQSIIVLPQGIMTFTSGFKTYYKQIIEGDVLIVSIFHPKAPWQAELAMARNPIIYGLAEEIYVAESSEKGGTWSGVIDGLRKGREIYVRLPEPEEKNANTLLIEKGAIPVDLEGNPLSELQERATNTENALKPGDIKELEEKIRAAFNGNPLSAKELLSLLKLDWSVQKLNTLMKKLPFIETVKRNNTQLYQLKGKDPEQATLF